MKQILSLVCAGVIGGFMAFGLVEMTEDKQVQEINQSPNATFVNHTVSTPFNFIDAAAIAVPAVVHITASESEQLAQQRFQDKPSPNRNNPFGEFFNFDMDEFFGGGNFFGPKRGTGSGVIISSDGYIVTNNHVVSFADDIKVILSDQREYMAELVGKDPSSDLAVIKIEATGLQTVQFGNSDEVQVGEWVLAVGNPFSKLESTVTAGIVSAKGRDLDIIEGEKAIEEFIQTDAAVNPGNSGGALVDANGKLIGINTAIATPTGVFAGYSFAIPINMAKHIIEDIRKNGNIERANLGLIGYDIDKQLAEEKNLSVQSGIFVEKLQNGSGAQFSGVQPGDVVIKANKMSVGSFEDIKKVMQFSKVGDTIELEIIRKGKYMTIPVKIKKRA